jgi:hypothetical protein
MERGAPATCGFAATRDCTNDAKDVGGSAEPELPPGEESAAEPFHWLSHPWKLTNEGMSTTAETTADWVPTVSFPYAT